jgi:predicted dehydrogenase
MSHFMLMATQGVVLGESYSIDRGSGWEKLPVDDAEIPCGCRRSVAAFLKSLVEGTEVPVPGRDACASLAACVAADESAATGKAVVPDEAAYFRSIPT